MRLIGLLAVVVVAGAVFAFVALRPDEPAGSGPAISGGSPDAPIKNVLIFLVDTLRADHLGCYGYPRDTSPNVDRFAAESVLFERSFSVSPWTRTSVASLFTSFYPVTHGCQDREDSAANELTMMAEVFRDNGYRTCGFSTNISVSAKFNMDQGFDAFTYFEREPWFEAHAGRRDPGYVPIEGMMPATFRWLDQAGDQPFFLYFHCTDPHYQYLPPAKHARWGAAIDHDRYDGEIRYVDHHFGRLIGRLITLGKLDETLVIFTADHGEEWGEHGGKGHGHSLYNELLEVPLIVRHPRFGPGRRREVVRLVDVWPALIELCQLKAGGGPLQGRSIEPLLSGLEDPAPDERFVFAEVMYPSKMEGLSYQVDGWKLIWTIRDQTGKRDRWELYHVAEDPREQTDLAGREPARLAELQKLMTEARRAQQRIKVEGVRTTLDPETLKALKSLGYVE